MGRSTSEDARVDEACEADTGDVTGAAVDAFEIPDGFGRFGVDLVKEALSSLLAIVALPKSVR